MAARNEAFLSIEAALASRINSAYRRATSQQIQQMASAAKKGDFDTALDILADLDVSGEIAAQRGNIRLFGMTSILFGARDFARADQTIFSDEPPPAILDVATATTAIAAVNVVNETLRQSLRDRLTREAIFQRTTGAATKNFVGEFVSFAKVSTKNNAQLISSLHTSRLASWGHLKEAESREVTTYTISEVLDDRTCPVCEFMDGKSFEVEKTLRQLETQLSVQNPDELKGIAPWVKQDKESIRQLRAMSNQELSDNGILHPPFHANCRGLLVSSV